jgi:ATP-dependent DNA ligase
LTDAGDRRQPNAAIELNGDDLRCDLLEVRKVTLASASAKVVPHACKPGLEGIVSKRKDSPYRSDRSPDWLKVKNPKCAGAWAEDELRTCPMAAWVEISRPCEELSCILRHRRPKWAPG